MTENFLKVSLGMCIFVALSIGGCVSAPSCGSTYCSPPNTCCNNTCYAPCQDGYVVADDCTCRVVIRCGENMCDEGFICQNKVCVCPDGYFLAGDTCQKITQTPHITPPVTTTAQPSLRDTHDTFYRSYTWKYGGKTWIYSLSIPTTIYEYYQTKPHNRESNYAQYALSDYDRPFLQGMVEKFQEVGDKEGYSDYETIEFLVTFVQSLPYTSDSVTTGFDEYPRFPIETLVDDGGDCEDTSILTAALLNELGYGAVLLELPHHMAVGVKGSDTLPGSYYEYLGSRYYYLETTGEGFDIGQMPEEYRGQQAIIRPMIQVPKMDVSFSANVQEYDASYVYYRVRCDIENIGPGTARNPKVYIAALALSRGTDVVWEPDATIDLDDYVEGSTGWAEATIRVPRRETSQIKVVLYGDNFEPVEVISERFTT